MKRQGQPCLFFLAVFSYLSLPTYPYYTMTRGFLLFAIVASYLSACRNREATLFHLVPPEESGVTFANRIQEYDTFNILTHEYIYNGGGVAISDFNGDGLQDIFFTGNMVGNRLYINRGNFRFDDVTEAAGVGNLNSWNQGVAIADVNHDDRPDIYVCTTFYSDSTRRGNRLYINNGWDADGIPVFRDSAAAYGVADGGYATHAAFLDYDLDGDLDLYVMINVLNNRIPTLYRPKIDDGSAPNNDHLYRNNGNGTFTDVSIAAGIVHEGYGLGLAVSDVNNDGWPDLYVSNDYLANDILYINRQDGTFVNAVAGSTTHQSMFSMGNDAADFNNDGFVDLITLDMLGETSYRQKTTMGNKSYQSYLNNEHYGYEFQYMRNMLYVNQGVDSVGSVRFSEVGLMSGVYRTDWSWSPLFADFDNDGLKDLIVTNGFPKDLTDRDFANFRTGSMRNVASVTFMLDLMPVAKVPNYVFRNTGDLMFTDVTKAWGMSVPTFSNGAAFADLDNDGDLDYVINNLNDPAFLYENRLYSSKGRQDVAHYIRIRLDGPAGNRNGLGAKVTLYADSGSLQFHDHSVYRGYVSTVEDIIHFGMGNSVIADSVRIRWPDGRQQVLRNVKADQVVSVHHAEASAAAVPLRRAGNAKILFRDVHKKCDVRFKHHEKDHIDFNTQRTLPHKFSQSGPALAVGDINGDGLEDLMIGGSAGEARTVFMQQRGGVFREALLAAGKPEEDLGLLLFDADADNDLDLYCATGSVEHGIGSMEYRDLFYRNDGHGNFSQDTQAIPDVRASGSCVRAADFDGDGDLDLFVGGRTVPGAYPRAGRSTLLRNEQGRFTDVTSLCPGLDSIGMVMDALWSDFDNDGKTDLIVAGEFMPLAFYRNTGTELEKISSGLEDYRGWWTSLAAGDFDHDGDIDYVAGNLGLNNAFHVSAEYPLHLYAKDFDRNGSIDPVLACYYKVSQESNKRILYPFHFWDELFSQSPRFRQQFENYKHYARTPLEGVLSPEDRETAVTLNANWMASSYIENTGNGRFNIKMLPFQAQVAPVNGMVVMDVNNDGHADVVLVGNDYGNEVFIGRYDAFTGLVLQGNGHGGFTAIQSSESGFSVCGDAKALVRLHTDTGDLLIASQNRDSLTVFASVDRQKADSRVFVPEQQDCRAELIHDDGRRTRIEFYHGSGYLSQSSRRLRIPDDASSLIVYTYQGKLRQVAVR